jgi:hypothetical protein
MRATLVFQRGFLWGTACALPAFARAEWLATWNAEVWHIQNGGVGWKESWRFTLGSVADILASRRDHPQEPSYLIHSPAGCLLTMALVNAPLALLGLFSSSLYRNLWFNPLRDAIRGRTVTPVFNAWHQQLYIAALCFLIARVVAAASPRPRVFSECRLCWNMSFNRAVLFYLTKLLLATSLFEYGLTLTALLPPLQIYGSVLAYVCMLRWAIRDQQQRCPVCLRRLTSPVQFGHPSCSLLDRDLQEYVCGDGHGVMHIPVAPLSGESPQAWLPLI